MRPRAARTGRTRGPSGRGASSGFPRCSPSRRRPGARRAHFAAHETVYKKFRAEWEGPIARWAGTDEEVKPRNALVAEAKIVSFWAYRDGVLQIAAKFDMALPEVAEAYLRALAAWASDDIPLAACRPA